MYTTLPDQPTEVDRQAAVIAGLRQLADFLETAPKLPLAPTTPLSFATGANWCDEDSSTWEVASIDRQIARVRTWAAILDVEVKTSVNEANDATYYNAHRNFGGVDVGISCIEHRPDGEAE
jgi:hypothetical protein